MATLRRDLETILLKYANNGHDTDPFYREVRDAVTAQRAVKKVSEIYLDFDQGMWRGIKQEDLARWMDCYSLTDDEVMYQLKKAKGWCMTAGARGKKKDWEKFITTWFSNAPRYVRVKNDRR